jgi:osmotically-inducible protein OsmY
MYKNNKLWSIALAVILSGALALPAFAQSQSGSPQSSSPSSIPSAVGTTMQSSDQAAKAMEDEGATPADQTLNQRIRQNLSADMALATVVHKIHLDTDNGEVTLQGFVTNDKQKADIATKVQQVSGVKKVENQLRIAAN